MVVRIAHLQRLLIGVALAALVAACSNPKNNFPTLANTGVLPLSTNNPYVGANLYLSDEMAQSPYLRNFLSSRGAPTAIEVIQESFRPTRVLLFYPGDREVYAADVVEMNKTRQWVIKGPFAIERRDYRSLAALENSLNGEPVLLEGGQPIRFRRPGAPVRPAEVLRPRIPTPVPTATPTPAKRATKRPVMKAPSEQLPDPRAFKPLNSDQQAIAMSQGFAERADNGDIIHTVGGDNESIGVIAGWYTGSTANAKALADLNGTNLTDPLPRGKRVRVPLALLKNLKVMPKQ